MRRSYVFSFIFIAFAAVWYRLVVFPKRPRTAETPTPRRLPQGPARPAPDGEGVRIVVNPNAGSPLLPAPTDALRKALPSADVHELTEDDDLCALLCDPAFAVIGAAGGDGTLAAAASVAAQRDALLIAIPAGTLNHLGRDLGLKSVDDAVAAVRAGYAASIDLGCVGDRTFVNTLTFGGYSHVVDTRERYERRLGKWLALAVALVVELPRMQPLRLEIDGRVRRVWLAWIGNCVYSPAGLAPAWRESLDDGLLDIRVVHDGPRFSRSRFALAVLSGRLNQCHVYSEWHAARVDVRSLSGPMRLAADGETFDGPDRFAVEKRRRAVRVALPPPV